MRLSGAGVCVQTYAFTALADLHDSHQIVRQYALHDIRDPLEHFANIKYVRQFI